MNRSLTSRWFVLLVTWGLLPLMPALLMGAEITGAKGTPSPAPHSVRVVAIQGTNWWIAPLGAADWVLASTRMPQDIRPGDRVRTGRHTRLFLQTPELGVIQIPPLSTLEISPPTPTARALGIRLLNGLMYFFHRGTPKDVEIHTRTASAAIRGTEFVAEAREDGGLLVRVLEGSVALSNDLGTVLLQKGEDGTAPTGQSPTRTSAVYAINGIQWCLYYPAVLDLEEIPFTESERRSLEASLLAYREGDLVNALGRHAAGPEPRSAAERVYLASLLLATGQVKESEAVLGPPPATGTTLDLTGRLATALRLMQAATRGEPRPIFSSPAPELASEWLAESYYRQSERNLDTAREAARAATRRSPNFAFAWVRLAELEFSFGQRTAAREALVQGTQLAPRQAAAVALQGFLLCAEDRIPSALEQFEHSIALDPGLANGWLGRGLSRIRQGRLREGLEDLEVAAAVEPQRAVLRSYLGKAFAITGDGLRAQHELTLAQSLDGQDPTAWLYAALLDQEQGRINEGIRNLERSKELNAGRSVYRSRHLLDEDQAVRGANLSTLYREAGMADLSRREAADAVNTDYANYSAHLFLANSYNELRDPGQVDLRYETPWFSEYLVANLLAPVGAGTLSQTVSAQEFSRLFERDRLGLASLTEYGSNGDWIQSAAQYGTLAGTAYALEEDYRTRQGERVNNDLWQLTLSLQVKQQLGPRDSVYLQSIYYEARGGDLGRVYDPEDAARLRATYRFAERQEPLLIAGYHHEWAPGHHTLVSAARLHDDLRTADPAQPVLLVSKDLANAVTGTLLTTANSRYRSEQEIFGAELQQIAQIDTWTFIGGARVQEGDFDTQNRQQNLADQTPSLPTPLEQQVNPGMQRWTAYGYAQWQIAEPFWFYGGLTYDHLRYPSNFRFAPLGSDESSREQWSPKAGALWKLSPRSTLRGAYTRSLGGVSLDQSYRLEPSQIAGLNQAWRGLIPDSVVGSQTGARMEMGSLEWDHRFPIGTYLALRGELGRSQLTRQVGVLDLRFLAEPSSTPEHLDYEEASLTLNVNQMIGESVAIGSQYRFTQSRLEDRYPEIPDQVPHLFPPSQLRPRQNLEGQLHQLQLFAVINHESGWFARIESILSSQHNAGYEPALPGDTFWQFNAFGGYRFRNRRAEIRLGLLNLTSQDYRLNPLNLSPELPRERTFVTRLQLNF